jgi:hypothetical protein
MNVDEAGRERKSVACDALEGIAVAQVSDQRYATIDDRDVGRERRAPQSVENSRAFVHGM